jgi:tetratricopeptide (TPR) repeat protein
MKYLLPFLMTFCLSPISAQTVDSLAIKQVDSLISLNRDLVAKRQFEEALVVIEQAEKLTLAVIGRQSAIMGKCLHNHARTFQIWGKPKEAEPLYLEAIDIRKKVLGKEHPDYAASLNNLAILYYNMGNYEKAEPLYLEAKTIFEKAPGKEHPDYAWSLNNLANLYLTMGNHEKAEPLYLEAKSIREKALGKEHPDYAASLNNLANLYYNMGNYEKVELLYLEAKTIQEKVLGKEHPNYASCLNNLANLYKDMGNYEKAEPLLLEAKTIREKALGKEHPDYALSLLNLGSLYYTMGNYEKAEPLYLESKTIREKALGKEHPDYAMSLNNLAIFYMNMGNYKKAEPLFLESKTIREKALGKEHPDYAISLNNLANLYEKQSRYSESAPLLTQKYALDQARLSKAISFLSERELSIYTATFQTDGDRLGSYVLARLTPRAMGAEVKQLGTLPALIFDHTLFYKGFLLTAAAQLNATSDGTPESKEMSLSLKSYRRRLAAEYAKPIAERKNVAELEEKANTAEKELARTMTGYTEAKRQVKWEAVMSTLKKDEAAIEFVSFKVNFPNETDSTMYAALLLKPGSKQPEIYSAFRRKIPGFYYCIPNQIAKLGLCK